MAPLIPASARTPNTSESSGAAEPTPPSNSPCTKTKTNGSETMPAGMSPDRSLEGPFQILMDFLAKRPVSRWHRIPALQMQSPEALPQCSSRCPPQQLFWSQSWVPGGVMEKPVASIWWHWEWHSTLLKEGEKSHLVQTSRKWRKGWSWGTYWREAKVSEPWESPELPPAGALLEPLLHPPAQAVAAIFFSLFSFLKTLKSKIRHLWPLGCWEIMILLLTLFSWAGYIGLAQVFCLTC